jgi:glycosyltransferase involved in cell wall biosynthesis
MILSLNVGDYSMRVLQITVYGSAGAGRACFRLHQGLRQASVDSLVLEMCNRSGLASEIELEGYQRHLKQLQITWYRRVIEKLYRCSSTFSINVTPSFLIHSIQKLQPDILHLHWVGWEFLRIEDLAAFSIPIVWTLHDMWPFTGGCHYSYQCDRYQSNCGFCPQLQSSKPNDLSRWVHHRKQKVWERLPMTFISPSQWMAQCARSSTLLLHQQIKVIPNGLDLNQYYPLEKSAAKAALNLPTDQQLILFGAVLATHDPRKGFHLLQAALNILSNTMSQSSAFELVVFGANAPDSPVDLGFKVHYLGHLEDVRLVQAYSAADVFVVPSMEDNLPNTVMEALACGTPCVGFQVGGIPDMVEHLHNGYLATPYDVKEFADGINWVLGDRDRYPHLCTHARQTVERSFSLDSQVQQHQLLYQSLLNRD